MMVKYHSIVKAFYLQKVWANDKSQILYTTILFSTVQSIPIQSPYPPPPPPQKKETNTPTYAKESVTKSYQ